MARINGKDCGPYSVNNDIALPVSPRFFLWPLTSGAVITDCSDQKGIQLQLSRDGASFPSFLVCDSVICGVRRSPVGEKLALHLDTIEVKDGTGQDLTFANILAVDCESQALQFNSGHYGTVIVTNWKQRSCLFNRINVSDGVVIARLIIRDSDLVPYILPGGIVGVVNNG